MTSPVWDGRGQDPWLTDRLNSRLNAGVAERRIRAALWAALSGWLVETGRQVLRGGRPDLDAIWARAPQWRNAVDQVVAGAVRPAMATGYTGLLGRGFPWEQRAFVSGYLAEVTNRMVRVPDEVYDLVASQVSQAVNLGEGIPAIADRVDNVLSTTATEHWPNRATVVARTETIGALNSGRYDAFRAFAEQDGGQFEKVWLSTLGPRTRASHVQADGQRVGLDDPFVVGGFSLQFPGDPEGPPQEVIQCRCDMLLVEPGEMTDMSNRQFLGE